MIIGMDIINTILIEMDFYYNTIDQGKGYYQGCMAPMVVINDYDFQHMNVELLPFSEEYFLNVYLNKCYKYKSVH